VWVLGAGCPRPIPDPDAGRGVPNGFVHREPLRRRLLAGDDHVHILTAAQTVVRHRQQGVRVRRQVDAHDVGLLVDDVIDEPRVLMAEPVVVLTPDVRREQVVERGHGRTPRDVASRLQPLRVLVEHRVLVAREEPVTPREQISLEPALAEMLAQDFHHPAIGRDMFVGRDDAPRGHAIRDFEQRIEPVGARLVGTEHAEVVPFRIPDHDVAEETAQHARRLAVHRARCRNLDRVVAEVGEEEVAR
jgi:hypothetical protein